MDEVDFSGHLSAALFLNLTSPHNRVPSSFPGVSFQLLPVCCWSKYFISSLLFWCISLPLAEWAVVLLSVWKGCQEPSQALRKHRHCRRLFCCFSIFFFSCGMGKKGWLWRRAAEWKEQVWDPPFLSQPMTFSQRGEHFSPLQLKKSIVETNIKALRMPTPSCTGGLGDTLLKHCTGFRKKRLLWEGLSEA